MLVKEDINSINFIDEKDNFVGFRNTQCCCENFGWIITDLGGNHIDIIENDPEFLSGFLFNTNEAPEEPDYFGSSAGGSVVFQLVNNMTSENLSLTLYNHHSGYYFHGWESSFGHKGRL